MSGLQLTNTLTWAWGSTDWLDWLRSVLTVHSNRIDYSTQQTPDWMFYTEHKDGYVLFGTGLLPWLWEQMTAAWPWLGQRVGQLEIVDKRRRPGKPWVYGEGVGALQFTPYDDQLQVAKLMLERERGVLDLATNQGKTYSCMTFIALTQMRSALQVVPLQSLLYQTSQDFEQGLGLPPGSVGRIGDGIFDPKPITVAVQNSLVEHLYKLDQDMFDTLIYDEAHKGISGMGTAIASHFDAPYRFWISGTAYRDGDNYTEYMLTALAGPCLAKVGNLDLVKAGRSARPLVRFLLNEVDVLKQLQPGQIPQYLTPPEAYALLTRDEQRNQLVREVVEMARARGLRTLIFVEHKQHAARLKDMMPWSEVAIGASAKRNERIKEHFTDGRLDTVIATSTWREGLSIKTGIHVMIQAGGRKSYLKDQDFGRPLRQNEFGWTIVVDFCDIGLPQAQKHSEQRRRRFEQMGFRPYMVELDKMDSIFTEYEADTAYYNPQR